MPSLSSFGNCGGKKACNHPNKRKKNPHLAVTSLNTSFLFVLNACSMFKYTFFTMAFLRYNFIIFIPRAHIILFPKTISITVNLKVTVNATPELVSQ